MSPVVPGDPALTQLYVALLDDVAAALAAADPEGLIAVGCPEDEYALEAAELVRRTIAEADGAPATARLAGEVFAAAFGSDGTPARFGAVGASVWARVEQLRRDGGLPG